MALFRTCIYIRGLYYLNDIEGLSSLEKAELGYFSNEAGSVAIG